jgi:hypothetical protein
VQSPQQQPLRCEISIRVALTLLATFGLACLLFVLGEAATPATADSNAAIAARSGSVPPNDTFDLYFPIIANQPSVEAIPSNRNFESGQIAWDEFSTHRQALIRPVSSLGAAPHGGTWAARFGGLDSETSLISQAIVVPGWAPCLVYWHWIVSEDYCAGPGTPEYDRGGVGVNGGWLDKYNLCAGTATGGWVQHKVDMSGYADKSIVLNFAAATDSSFASILYVDDVSFQPSSICSQVTSTPNPRQPLVSILEGVQ